MRDVAMQRTWGKNIFVMHPLVEVEENGTLAGRKKWMLCTLEEDLKKWSISSTQKESKRNRTGRTHKINMDINIHNKSPMDIYE